MKISDLVRSAMVDAFVQKVDEGAGAGTLNIWEATGGSNPPAATTTSISDDDTNYKLLAAITLNDPAFAAASGGTAALDVSPAVEDTSINKTGTAEFWRILDSDSECHAQGSCGTSGADINFNSVAFVSGGVCSITSLDVTQPAGT